MQFTDIILLLVTAALAWWILVAYGVIGGNKAAKKAVEDKKAAQSLLRKRKIMTWIVGNFERFGMQLGGGLKESVRTKYDFYITRLEKKVPWLNRNWKPIELVGCFRMIGFVGILIMCIGMSSLTFNVWWAFGILAFTNKLFEFACDNKIRSEDHELEDDFPDLFLILNPKLKMGANARIAPVLNEYLVTMERTYAKTEHLAIRKFVRQLRSTIEMYPDETLALTKIRIYYRTPVIVNFCNVAIQAMSGIDNEEKLIAFEQELTRRKMDLMRKRAAKLVARAQRATYLMYIILFEFVILTFWSRLGGNLDAMMGLF